MKADVSEMIRLVDFITAIWMSVVPADMIWASVFAAILSAISRNKRKKIACGIYFVDFPLLTRVVFPE